MKYFLLTIAVVAIGFFGMRRASNHSSAPSTALGSGTNTSPWTNNLQSALAMAKQSDKPVLIDFYATWCPPCKMMDKKTFPDSTVVAELENWVPVKIDVDRNRAIAQEFRISAMPTMVLLSPNGKELARREGYLGPSELVAFATATRKKKFN